MRMDLTFCLGEVCRPRAWRMRADENRRIELVGSGEGRHAITVGDAFVDDPGEAVATLTGLVALKTLRPKLKPATPLDADLRAERDRGVVADRRAAGHVDGDRRGCDHFASPRATRRSRV